MLSSSHESPAHTLYGDSNLHNKQQIDLLNQQIHNLQIQIKSLQHQSQDLLDLKARNEQTIQSLREKLTESTTSSSKLDQEIKQLKSLISLGAESALFHKQLSGGELGSPLNPPDQQVSMSLNRIVSTGQQMQEQPSSPLQSSGVLLELYYSELKQNGLTKRRHALIQ